MFGNRLSVQSMNHLKIAIENDSTKLYVITNNDTISIIGE